MRPWRFLWVGLRRLRRRNPINVRHLSPCLAPSRRVPAQSRPSDRRCKECIVSNVYIDPATKTWRRAVACQSSSSPISTSSCSGDDVGQASAAPRSPLPDSCNGSGRFGTAKIAKKSYKLAYQWTIWKSWLRPNKPVPQLRSSDTWLTIQAFAGNLRRWRGPNANNIIHRMVPT